jgi:hypothetical protein
MSQISGFMAKFKHRTYAMDFEGEEMNWRVRTLILRPLRHNVDACFT